MAADRMALRGKLDKAAAGGDVDFLRGAVKALAEALMELEVAGRTLLPSRLRLWLGSALGQRAGYAGGKLRLPPYF